MTIPQDNSRLGRIPEKQHSTLSACFNLVETIVEVVMPEYPYSKIGYVYIVTNQINGKQYVGQTLEGLHSRWMKHKYCARTNKHPTNHFMNAIRKHGEDNFIIEPIKIVSLDSLDSIEEQYIAELDTYNNGYNSTLGGQSGRGRIMSDEQKKAIGNRHRGKTISKEHRESMSKKMKGRVSNRKGCIVSEEQKKKISETLAGRRMSDEHYENNSVKMKEYWERWSKGLESPRNHAVGYKNPAASKIMKKRLGQFITKWEIVGEIFKPRMRMQKGRRIQVIDDLFLVKCEKCDTIYSRAKYKHKEYMICRNCETTYYKQRKEIE